MDLRQLRYYKEIVEQGSISKAATILKMAQPPLSMLLKQLEEELSATLIKRYRQQWEVTEIGQMLYKHAIKLLSENEDFEKKVQYMKDGNSGELLIGVSSSCLNLIGSYVKQFMHNFPNVTLQIVKGDSRQLIQQLEENKLDLIIVLKPEKYQSFEWFGLNTYSFSLALPSIWHIETSKLEDLQRLFMSNVYISLEAMEGFSMLEEIEQQLRSHEIEFRKTIKCKDVSIATKLVEEGVGFSILPVINEQNQRNIDYRKMSMITTNVHPGVLYKTNANHSVLCQNFINIIKEHT